jgi:beta-lactam-binding protein with PASTA domain
MTSSWVITTAAERLVLDDTRRGTTTLTVTNTANRSDQAVFEIVTDPAAQSWFTVDDPQRAVPAASSVQYVVKAEVPPTGPAGHYQLQGRVYSANSVPEETSVLSNRILLEVAGTVVPPPPRLRRWWPVIPAALVVLAIVAVVVIVANRNQVSSPSAAATPSAHVPTVTVPSVASLPEDQAVAALEQAGLTPVIKHRHANPVPPTQSIPANTVVARGTTVEIDYSSILAAPVITSPVNNAVLPRIAPDGFATALGAIAYSIQATWTQAEPFVTSWQVVILSDVCSSYVPTASGAIGRNSDRYFVAVSTVVTTPSYLGTRYVQPKRNAISDCGNEFIEVAPIDDFGRIGTFARYIGYHLV